MKWFRRTRIAEQRLQIEQLIDKLKARDAELERAKDTIDSMGLYSRKLEKQDKEQRQRIDELLPKLREQAEADLLLVSLRIVDRVGRGEKVKKDDPDVNMQSAYHQQLAGLQAQMGQYRGGYGCAYPGAMCYPLQ